MMLGPTPPARITSASISLGVQINIITKYLSFPGKNSGPMFCRKNSSQSLFWNLLDL